MQLWRRTAKACPFRPPARSAYPVCQEHTDRVTQKPLECSVMGSCAGLVPRSPHSTRQAGLTAHAELQGRGEGEPQGSPAGGDGPPHHHLPAFWGPARHLLRASQGSCWICKSPEDHHSSP